MDWVYMPHVPTGFESANPILDWDTATLNRRGLVGYQYLDARDAASAYRLAIESDDLAQPETIYVATDRTTRAELRELLRGDGRFTDVAEQMEPDDLFLSIAHAQRVLGYRPRHSWLGSRDRAA
jgi:nucleoside-diphosphate-sugar epimerase